MALLMVLVLFEFVSFSFPADDPALLLLETTMETFTCPANPKESNGCKYWHPDGTHMDELNVLIKLGLKLAFESYF